MTGGCTEKCHIMKLDGQMKRYRNMYMDGKLYCRTCEFCAFYEGVWCPCCSNRMRRNPTNHKAMLLVKEPKRI